MENFVYSQYLFYVYLGFISLDCGLLPNESPYTKISTGLIFSSDTDFIQSGIHGRINNEWEYKYKQYNALRYFPEGIRNCYNLTVKQGLNYLIRAGFAYGNYDGLSIYPRFDIYIGPNLWTSVFVKFKVEFEIIHTARSNFLQICLVKTGTTTPFISTLELRPLRNDSYSTQSGSLLLKDRNFYKSRYLRYFIFFQHFSIPNNSEYSSILLRVGGYILKTITNMPGILMMSTIVNGRRTLLQMK